MWVLTVLIDIAGLPSECSHWFILLECVFFPTFYYKKMLDLKKSLNKFNEYTNVLHLGLSVTVLPHVLVC